MSVLGWSLATWLMLVGVAGLLITMSFWSQLAQVNRPRVGMFGLTTQRGDRLFLSLVIAGFIHAAWLGLAPLDLPLWGASIVSLVVALVVFRFG